MTSPFDSLLRECRDLACDRLDTAISGMLDKADEALTTLSGKTQDAEAQRKLLDARDVAVKKRQLIEEEFHGRYLDEFEKLCKRAKMAGEGKKAGASDFGELELSLVEEEDLNETLKFNELAAKVRRFCEEELGALDQRVGVLLGDANLEADDNPLSPKAILDGYKQTCRAADSNADVRMVLLRLFDDHVLDEIRSIYKDVNELLVQNSILPKIRYGVVRSKDGKPLPQSGQAGGEGEKGEAPAPTLVGDKPATPGAGAGAEDVFASIAKLMASTGAFAPPGGAAGVPGAVAGSLAGADLMGSLSRLQIGDLSSVTAGNVQIGAGGAIAGAVNVLRDLRQTNVGASMGQMDLMTLDVVSMLFDQLFDDPKVPAEVKALSGRLQIPILKVAIADKTLFSKKEHPARLLLDTIGEISARLPADFSAASPQHAKIEKIFHDLIEGYQDKLEVFDAAGEQLRALVAEEDKKADEVAKVAAKEVEVKESLAVSRAAAQEEIRKRVFSAKAPRAVLEFLVRQWVKFLLIIHAKEGPESESWQAALGTMDQLLWSVEPKTSVIDRRKLATTVPNLLKGITAGLKTAAIPDDVRTTFFTELMALHTQAIGTDQGKPKAPEATLAPAKDRFAAAPAKVPATAEAGAPAGARAAAPAAASAKAAAPGVAAKAGAHAAASSDDELDFTQEIVVQNPFGQGEVQVDELDFTETGTFPASPVTAAATASTPAGAVPVKSSNPVPKEIPKEVQLPTRLKEGVWVAIRGKGPDDPPQHAKLLYVSPLKTRYLFVDRKGKTMLECNRSELAKRFRLRDLALLNEPPETSLFDRIMSGVMGKLGGAPKAA